MAPCSFPRPNEDVLKIKFAGEIIGPQAGFVLLGQDQQFWVMMPNAEQDTEGKDAPRNVVYAGLESAGSSARRSTFRPVPRMWPNLS